MRKTNWVVCGLVILGGFVGSVYWVRQSPLSARVRYAVSNAGAPELDPQRVASSSGTSEEIQSLRAELRRKDALLLALASAQKVAADKPTQAVSVPPVDNLDPVARAVDILDERMLMAPKDSRRAAEKERALRDAVGASTLGEAKVASMYCGGADLCKVTLTAANDRLVDESISTLSGHMPKTFGASAVFRLSDGQSAMYLAQSSEDLDVESPKLTQP